MVTSAASSFATHPLNLLVRSAALDPVGGSLLELLDLLCGPGPDPLLLVLFLGVLLLGPHGGPLDLLGQVLVRRQDALVDVVLARGQHIGERGDLGAGWWGRLAGGRGGCLPLGAEVVGVGESGGWRGGSDGSHGDPGMRYVDGGTNSVSAVDGGRKTSPEDVSPRRCPYMKSGSHPLGQAHPRAPCSFASFLHPSQTDCN